MRCATRVINVLPRYRVDRRRHNREGVTSRVQQWLGEREVDTLAVSDWVMTEVSAALSLKVRTGDLTPQVRGEAEAAYRAFLRKLIRLPVTTSDFDHAATLARSYKTGLRGGDALHLAVASSNGATLCTLDKRFAHACDDLGLPFELMG